MHKKLLWTVTTLVLALSMMIGVSAAGNVGYEVQGTIGGDGKTLTAEIYAKNINAICGSISLDFDQTMLELSDYSSLAQAVVEGPLVTVTSEGRPLEELISKTEGFVQFAWYPKGSRLYTKEKRELVAKIDFTLKDGITQNDLDSATLRIKYVEEEDIFSDTGAWIRGEGLVDYKNNVDQVFDCEVEFSYPKSTTNPDTAAKIETSVKDTAGGLVKGAKMYLGTQLIQDEGGVLQTDIPLGIYRYKVWAPGYQSVFGTVTVKAQTSLNVQLKSTKQLVEAVAQNIDITFAEGDSAQKVTRSFGLPQTGENGVQIAWKSSNTLVVTDSGTVFPAEGATNVVMTATATMDGNVATKTFNITVAKKADTPSGGQPENPDIGGGGTEHPTEPVFNDLGSVPWAREAILTLAQEKVINGTSKTTYSPNENITRGDFVTLLMRMLKPQGNPTENFADVPQNSYYYNEIALAKAIGIAQGSGDNRFNPRDYISRQDMFTLAYRALNQLEYISTNDGTNAISIFADAQSVAPYAKTGVNALTSAGLINGDDKKCLNPAKNSTRAETAVFLYNIFMKYMQ